MKVQKLINVMEKFRGFKYKIKGNEVIFKDKYQAEFAYQALDDMPTSSWDVEKTVEFDEPVDVKKLEKELKRLEKYYDKWLSDTYPGLTR